MKLNKLLRGTAAFVIFLRVPVAHGVIISRERALFKAVENIFHKPFRGGGEGVLLRPAHADLNNPAEYLPPAAVGKAIP